MTTTTIHLHGIGRVPAKTAGDLTVGDITIWNYGYPSQVCGIVPKGAQSVIVHLADIKTGYLAARTMRKTSLVGVRP